MSVTEKKKAILRIKLLIRDAKRQIREAEQILEEMMNEERAEN